MMNGLWRHCRRLSSSVHFAELDIAEGSKRALQSMGFVKLTDVQAKTLPSILAGRDVLAKAGTGTGKTVAFLLPSIQKVVKRMQSNAPSVGRGIRAPVDILVISPNRELASQIAVEARALSEFFPKIQIQSVVGGSNKKAEANRISSGVNILVGTPGRLLDHFQTHESLHTQVSRLQVLILDEADQLLDCGFRREIEKIVSFLPDKTTRQTLLFSATMPHSMHHMTHVAMKPNHEFIDTRSGCDDTIAGVSPQIEQRSVVVPFEEHFFALHHLIQQHAKEFPNAHKVIVFFPAARVVSFTSRLFVKAGIPVYEMHSRLSQSKRTTVSDKFRKSQRAVMFTSDVSARGVDYPNVSLIVQVGSTTPEQYVHRIGRTGRAGQMGKAIIMLSPFEERLLQQLPQPMKKITADSLIPDNVSGKGLVKALSSVADDPELSRTAAQAYQAFLGFYKNAKLKLSAIELVKIANQYANIMGLSSVPELSARTIGMMGLRGTPGLHITTAPLQVDQHEGNGYEESDNKQRQQNQHRYQQGRYPDIQQRQHRP